MMIQTNGICARHLDIHDELVGKLTHYNGFRTVFTPVDRNDDNDDDDVVDVLAKWYCSCNTLQL